MTSFAENRGRQAALAGELASRCPYKGRTPGSEKLRRLWILGFEAERRREIERQGLLQGKRGARARSPYVERRLQEIAEGEPR